MCEGIYEPFLFRLQLPCSIARGELQGTGQKPVAIPPLFLVFQLSFSARNIGRIRKIILVQCFDLGRLKIPRNAVFLHCFLNMGKLSFLRLDGFIFCFYILALCQSFQHQCMEIPALLLCQCFTDVCRGAVGIQVQRFLKESIRLFPIPIFQRHIAPVKLGTLAVISGSHYLLNHLLHRGAGVGSGQKLLDASHQILDCSHLAHVLSLEFSKLLRHIIGIDALVAGNQVLGFVPCHKLEIAAPLILDPHGVIVFIIRTEGQHDFGRVQSSEDIRLVFLPQLVFQCNAGEEDTVALFRQGIVNILGNDAVHGALTVLVRLLVADENVIRLLFAGNLDDALADFFNLFCLVPVDLAGDHVRIFQGLLKVAVLHDALEAGTVAGGNFLAGSRVVHILDAVLAQH